MKRPKPLTCCTNCVTPGFDIQLANGKCGRVFNGERCNGMNGSTIQENSWSECPSCAATGVAPNVPCGQCDGYGWLFQGR
jgi:hypothetical protein